MFVYIIIWFCKWQMLGRTKNFKGLKKIYIYDERPTLCLEIKLKMKFWRSM